MDIIGQQYKHIAREIYRNETNAKGFQKIVSTTVSLQHLGEKIVGAFLMHQTRPHVLEHHK